MAATKAKPYHGAVVRAVVVGVDFGRITYTPGQYGIVCATGDDGNLDFPLVHWQDGYTCNCDPSDFLIVAASAVARIGSNPAECGYCQQPKARRR